MTQPIGPNAGGRAGQPGRPGVGNRLAQPLRSAALGGRTANRWGARPTWSNISPHQISGIHNRWNNAINRAGTAWGTKGGERWNRWGDNIRNKWHAYRRGYSDGWFNRSWWDRHNVDNCGWHYSYSYRYDSYPDSYWWTSPTYYAVADWCSSSSDSSQPVYYDYGTNGNVTYQENNVYIYGEQVASADEFAESAAALATVSPPANTDEAVNAEWMPLGTFAVSASENDTQPSRIIQIAVNKQGIIAGTLFNTQTDQVVAVQGCVDKSTQRVAFRIGDDESIVAETGLYNLTLNEVPVMVHFGKDKTETYLLVRMESPK
jgi:hypothetical protein